MASQQYPERPGLGHARTKSGFSFRSHRSSGSADKIKLDLTETEKDRRKTKFSEKSFANPNRAVLEAEPAVRAQEERTFSTLSSLAGLKDWQGNPIIDADVANPTRSRMERPLDTIRSFEAAVDGTHARRSQSQTPRPGAPSHFNNFDSDSSRRSSFVGAGSTIGTDININPRSNAAIPGPQYTPRRQPYRQASNDPYGRGPPSAYSMRGGMGPRMHTAPPVDRGYGQHQRSYSGYNGNGSSNGYIGHNGYTGHNGYNGYPYHGHNDSYDTNGDSAGSSEPWGTSTDPSSENSSVDRIHAPKHSPDSNGDAYGGGYYANGANGGSPYGNNSPMRQSQPIAEESWNEDRGLEGAYDYQGAPHQSGRPYQPATPTTPNGLRKAPSWSQLNQPGQRPFQNRGPQQQPGQQQPHPQPQPQPQPQQPSQRLYQAQSQPQTQSEQRRNVMPLGGEMRRPVGPPADQPLQLSKTRSQPQRPRTLEKRGSEKPAKPEKRKSWLKRIF